MDARIMSESRMPSVAEIVMDAARAALVAAGEASDAASVVEALTDAIALTFIAEAQDPGDDAALDDVAEAVRTQIVEMVRAGREVLARMVQ